MTLLQQLLTSLAAKENPEPREILETASKLERLGMLALYERAGYDHAAADVRRRIGERA